MSGKIGRLCPVCKRDNWFSLDLQIYYAEICKKCGKRIEYKKQDFLNNFICRECGSTSGTLNDSDNYLSIICTNCRADNIILEKRYVEIRKTHNDNNTKREEQVVLNKTKVIEKPVCCPRCKSVQIQATNRGYSLLTGFIGANKTVNHCLKCGYSWKPEL